MSSGAPRRGPDEGRMNVLTPGLVLFDTGVYIRFGRGEDYGFLGRDATLFHRTVPSAVVAAELYAGTRSHREKRTLDKLCGAHRALGHFTSPSAAAWIETRILLRRARSTFAEMDFVQHFRDLLIALEAALLGATLVTENIRDFARWTSLLASTRKTLRLFDPSRSS
jgi:predicted nucleic acid-binding protein